MIIVHQLYLTMALLQGLKPKVNSASSQSNVWPRKSMSMSMEAVRGQSVTLPHRRLLQPIRLLVVSCEAGIVALP